MLWPFTQLWVTEEQEGTRENKREQRRNKLICSSLFLLVPSYSSVTLSCVKGLSFVSVGLHTALRNRYREEQIQMITWVAISIYIKNKKNTKEQMDCSSYSFCSSYIYRYSNPCYRLYLFFTVSVPQSCVKALFLAVSIPQSCVKALRHIWHIV